MQAATQPTTKYKVGDIFTIDDKYLYEVMKIDGPFYVLEGYNKASPEFRTKYNEEIYWIDSSHSLKLYNGVSANPVKPAEPACECGAHKLGYVKPSRHHYGWCPFYRET